MTTEADMIRLHRKVTRAEEAASAARRERDELIRAAIAEGMTAYRVAKLLGIQQSAIARIRHAKP